MNEAQDASGIAALRLRERDSANTGPTQSVGVVRQMGL
jgi:hypothetical protein